MDNTKIKENAEYLRDFLTTIGFDQKMIEEDLNRLAKIVFVSAMQKFQPLIPKDQTLSKMESIQDFYKFYEPFVGKAVIDKILEEETERTVSDYLKAVTDQLPR